MLRGNFGQGDENLRGDARFQQVSKALGDRDLLWFGPRADDGERYLEFSQFRGAIGLTASTQGLDWAISYDTYVNCRHSQSSDNYETEFIIEQIKRINTDKELVIVPYRAYRELSRLGIENAERVNVAGPFRKLFELFSHKPWVEQQLSGLGIETLPWKYASFAIGHAIKEQLNVGPAVVRRSHSATGNGFSLLDDYDAEFVHSLEQKPDQYAVGPLLEGYTPVNVTACVYGDGSVTFYAPSVQLIGVPQLTENRFGYGGNDFSAVKNLISEDEFARMETVVKRIGTWMARFQFLGAFGVDFLVRNGEVLFCEINARFQGSSASAANISAALEQSDLYLDHLAAYFRLGSYESMSLAEWAKIQPDRSLVYAHNLFEYQTQIDIAKVDKARNWTMLPTADMTLDPDAAIGRIEFDHAVTPNGYELIEPACGWADDLNAALVASTGLPTATAPDRSVTPA